MRICILLLLVLISTYYVAAKSYRKGKREWKVIKKDVNTDTYTFKDKSYPKVRSTKRRICFFKNWVDTTALRNAGVAHTADQIDPFLCTHVNYCFMNVGSKDENWELIDRKPTKKYERTADGKKYKLDEDGKKIEIESERITKTTAKSAAQLQKLAELKQDNPDLKIIISVGGASHDKSIPRFHNMVADDSNIDRFVTSVVNFMENTKAVLKKNADPEPFIDGLSLDWEYPNWKPKIEDLEEWKSKPKAEKTKKKLQAKRDEERKRFIKLLKKLRDAFDENQPAGKKWILSASVSAGDGKIKGDERAYDPEKMKDYVDWVNVMAYAWWNTKNGIKIGETYENKTGHYTAMDKPDGDKNYMGTKKRTVRASIKWWIDEGMPREKINLGTATYGKTFKLENPSKHDLNDNTEKNWKLKALNGPWVKGKGYVSYFEICKMPETDTDRKWRKYLGIAEEKDEENPYHGTEYTNSPVKAPYASLGNLWVAYESPESLAYKVREVVNRFKYKDKQGNPHDEDGVGGISFWSLDLDDFKNMCTQNGDLLGHYPIIRSAAQALTRDCNDQAAKARKIKGGSCDWKKSPPKPQTSH